MTAILAWFLSSPTVLAIGGGIVAAFVAYMQGRLAGKAREREANAALELRAREVADEVDNDVGALPPELAREELRKWSKR